MPAPDQPVHESIAAYAPLTLRERASPPCPPLPRGAARVSHLQALAARPTAGDVPNEGALTSRRLPLRALDPWSRSASRIRDAESERHRDAGGVVGVVLLGDDPGGIDLLLDEVILLRLVHQVCDVEVLAEELLVIDVLPADRGAHVHVRRPRGRVAAR